MGNFESNENGPGIERQQMVPMNQHQMMPTMQGIVQPTRAPYYPDMNVIFHSMEKMIQISDDMHRMANYMEDIRNIFFVMSCLTVLGALCFLVSRCLKRKRDDGRSEKNNTDTVSLSSLGLPSLSTSRQQQQQSTPLAKHRGRSPYYHLQQLPQLDCEQKIGSSGGCGTPPFTTVTQFGETGNSYAMHTPPHRANQKANGSSHRSGCSTTPQKQQQMKQQQQQSSKARDATSMSTDSTLSTESTGGSSLGVGGKKQMLTTMFAQLDNTDESRQRQIPV